VKTKEHKLAVPNKASNNSISNHLSMKNISIMEKQVSLAAHYRFPFFFTKCPGILGETMETSRFLKKLWEPYPKVNRLCVR
jgi:hypothetical protein